MFSRAALVVGKVSALILLYAVSSSAYAADFEQSADAGLRMVATDNFTVEDDGSAETQMALTAGYNLLSDGQRTTTEIDYGVATLAHVNNPENDDVQHQLTATFGTEVVTNQVFFRAESAYYQTLITPGESIGLTELTDSDDTTNTLTLAVEPRVLQRFSNGVNAEAVLRLGSVTYEGTEAADSEQRVVNVRVARELGRLQSYISAMDDRVEDDNGTTTVISNAGVGAVFSISRRLAWLGEVGEERNDLGPSGEPFEGDYWSTSLRYTPTLNQSIEAGVSEGFIGTTYDLTWRREGRFSAALNYQEILTSASRRRLTPLDRPLQDESLVGVVEVAFVQERLDVELGYELTNNQIRIDLFQEDLDYLDPEFELFNSTLVGGGLTWISRPGAFLTVEAATREERRDLAGAPDNTVIRHSLQFDYAVGRQLTTALTFEQTQFDVEGEGVIEENSVVFELNQRY